MDPDGLDTYIDRWMATDTVTEAHEIVDNCECGTCSITAQLDANSKSGVHQTVVPVHGNIFSDVGAGVNFKWSSKEEGCCCTKFGWKQWRFLPTGFLGALEPHPDSDDPEAWYNPPNMRYDPSMDDTPGIVGANKLGRTKYNHYLRAQLICVEGPQKGKTLYTIDWQVLVRWRGSKLSDEGWHVAFDLHGYCGSEKEKWHEFATEWDTQMSNRSDLAGGNPFRRSRQVQHYWGGGIWAPGWPKGATKPIH